MSNFPGPECGVFCISIIDTIFRSALVLLSLLRASKYHYYNGPLKVEFFKCKTIHSILFCISVLQSISLRWFVNIVPIYIISRYTCRGRFTAISHWPTIIILFLSYFILHCHGALLFSQISNLFVCGIFNHNFFVAVKKIHNLWLLNNNNKCSNQITFTQTKKPLKYRALLGVIWSCWGRYWLRHKFPRFR